LKVEDFTLSRLAATIFCGYDNSELRAGIKVLISPSSIEWRRGGAFLFVSPLPARSSQGEDGELDATV